MKRKAIFLLIGLLLSTFSVLAQSPPPPPENAGSGGGPIGGGPAGAPIDGGLTVFIALAGLYAGKKFMAVNHQERK